MQNKYWDNEQWNNLSPTLDANGKIPINQLPDIDPVAHKSSHSVGGSDALTPEDIGAAKWFSSITTGSSSALTTSTSGFSLTDGATIRIKLHTDMSAGATLNVSDLGGKPIVDTQGKGVNAVAGSWLTLIYNAVTENFILQGSGGGVNKFNNDGYAGLLGLVNLYLQGV